MIDQDKASFAYNLIDLLPPDEGTVTYQERPAGDSTERVLAVEFQRQTILLQFVFDDSEMQERAYAEMIARGAKLLSYFLNMAVNESVDKDEALRAFQATFNVLMRDIDASRYRLQPDEADPLPPTVGEK